MQLMTFTKKWHRWHCWHLLVVLLVIERKVFHWNCNLETHSDRSFQMLSDASSMLWAAGKNTKEYKRIDIGNLQNVQHVQRY